MQKISEVQFTLVLAFMFQLTFFPACEVSKPMLILNGVQAVIFFALFLNFFRASYRRQQRKLGHDKEPLKLSASANDLQRNTTSASAGYATCASHGCRKENGFVRNRVTSVRRDMESTSAIKYLDHNYIAETVTIPE